MLYDVTLIEFCSVGNSIKDHIVYTPIFIKYFTDNVDLFT